MNIKSSSHPTVVSHRKEKRRRVRVGDPDFKPPDGGWGWLLVVACGFGNLFSFPMFHQFGLVFKEKFALVGIDTSQTLTILNLCVAFNTGVGLLNGPIFKLFSHRQVALVSALGVVVSLIVLSNCVSFWSHILMYSLCYGASFGLLESANSLAINTYFKEKRRSATGYSWTLTGFGPIVCPYIMVFLEHIYGVNGLIFIFAGVAMHSFACALFLQPVEWHTPYREPTIEPEKSFDSDKQSLENSNQFFSNEGYCASEPSTPVLNSRVTHNDTRDLYQENILSSQRSAFDLVDENGKGKKQSMNTQQKNESNANENEASIQQQDNNVVAGGVSLLTFKALDMEQKEILDESVSGNPVVVETATKPLDSIWQKFCHYFDIDLLKDPTYVALNLGLTFANVTEMNFSLATPIILAEFNFTEYETANFMSLLAATDIVVRLISSVVADRIGWSNRTYFLLGVMSMALGRVLLVHTQSYYIGMVVAVIIGSGKALRTIFMILVIPSHVPLERLPAAYGLQFAVSGITFVVLGPVVGWIRERVGSYVLTLHILNLLTYITAIAWTIDSWCTTKRKEKDNLKSKSVD
nr:monocarboxylate transporter 9-like [Leptinotarsa decemlineata]